MLTDAWPDGWWIMIREFGSEWRNPGAPEHSSNDAMLQACPTHQVAIGGCTYCIVSYIPRPAVTDPPSEWRQEKQLWQDKMKKMTCPILRQYA